jgi:hypothetical protein
VSRNTFAENLLALFTRREAAASIVGDLIEQSHVRARGWFTCEVVRLTFALCFRTLVSAPGRALRLAGLGLAVYTATYAVLFVAIGLPWYPWNRVGTADFWVRVAAVIVVSNLLTGAILARWRSHGNISAIAPLIAVWCAAWLIWPLLALAAYPWPSSEFWFLRGLAPWPMPGPWILAWTALIFPFLYLVPLLLGALFGQRRVARVIE